MALNVKFDFRDLNPNIDTIHDLGYKSDYNFKQIISALNLFSYRGVEIGPEEPEDTSVLWIDTSDETVEETSQNLTIISELMDAIASLQDRISSLENAISSGGGVIGDDGEITSEVLVLEDGTPFITELGIPFILES